MFYVYEWYIVETGEIIYVGKGTRLRYKVRKHNKFFNDMIRRYECDSRIVKEFEDEKDAFLFEHDRISELKSNGQCVCNIRDGGFGGTTEWWTDELREQYSKKNVMKSELQRKRMSKHNPMKNKETALKTNSKKRRAVIIGDKRYDSIKSAMDAEKTSYEVIANWCKKGVNSRMEKCKFEDSEQIAFTDKRYNKGGCRALIFCGKYYETAKDLAEELSVAVGTVLSWTKRGFTPQGEPCRYIDDDRALTYTNRYVTRNKKKAKPIMLNGIHYNSVDDAHNATGISKSTIYSYLQGRRKSKNYVCIYDNQQPSQGNTDNSTLEGSTTNE